MRTAVIRLGAVFLFPLLLAGQSAAAAELKPRAQAAWEEYVRLTEARVARDLKSPTAANPGESVAVQRLTTRKPDGQEIDPDSAMIHHWKGSVFIPGVTLARVLHFSQDYDQHQRWFQEVTKSKLLSRAGDEFRIFYQLKRTKVITVVYNTEHTVVYHAGEHEASSKSMTTKIAELDSPGEKDEREKRAGEDHGFLWHLNSYWRFTERHGGVIVECESISLSRGIPTGLGWLVKGYVESVPRESLVNTLTSFARGVKAG